MWTRERHKREGRLGPWRSRTVAIAALVTAAACFVWLTVFTVDTGEYAVVTEFGDPVQVITEPGLGFKYPYQSVTRFDNRLFVYSPPLSEFFTGEKTAVVASSAILWRIAEPRKYFETVLNRTGAQSRLNDILFAELGGAIGSKPFAAFISPEDGGYRAEDIMMRVTEVVRRIALRDYGIDVVDVQLKRFDFPERNRLRVYARMKSERGRISMKYRSEGTEEGLKIRADAEAERSRILSEAYKVSQQHRGEGEAEATRIYAETLGAEPDYYRLLRTLEASRKYVRDSTTIVLPVNSELFGLLLDSGHFDRGGSSGSVAETPEEEEVP